MFFNRSDRGNDRHATAGLRHKPGSDFYNGFRVVFVADKREREDRRTGLNSGATPWRGRGRAGMLARIGPERDFLSRGGRKLFQNKIFVHGAAGGCSRTRFLVRGGRGLFHNEISCSGAGNSCSRTRCLVHGRPEVVPDRDFLFMGGR